MLEYLNSIDTELLLEINSLHTQFLDSFMFLVSGKWIWVPMYVMVLFFMMKNNWRQAVTVLVIAALSIALADQISSGFIKHAVERFRPTHEPAIANLIHVVNGYRGGRFGFVSSHAANTVAFALLFSLLYKNRWFSLVVSLWAALVMYSRMYLGVHYPGDILGGIVVGLFSGTVCYYIYKYILRLSDYGKMPWLRVKQWNDTVLYRRQSTLLSALIVGWSLVITVIAFFVF